MCRNTEAERVYADARGVRRSERRKGLIKLKG